MKPIILYIDDEPHNLTVFEASLPSEWEIKTFSDPLKALEALESIAPSVIVSDQRMPGITGVRLLELAKKIHPHAVRIIVTGYSEEDLVVESVRKAQVFDYIKKPWEPDELEAGLVRALEYYRVNEEARRLHQSLVEREAALAANNQSLTQMTEALRKSHENESNLRKELECWAPPFLLKTLGAGNVQFPTKRDIVGLATDIINSSSLLDSSINGKSVRGVVLSVFSECIFRHGGWCESFAGDSGYAHFGLSGGLSNPSESALSAAREFRVALRNLSETHRLKIECGVALHVAKECSVDVRTVELNTPEGLITQKSFDTTSPDIDLLHRMENLMHQLPGTNLVLSESFLSTLGNPPANVQLLGSIKFKGQANPTQLHLLKSDLVSSEALEALKQQYGIVTTLAAPTKKAA